MSNPNDGGPAFPQPLFERSDGVVVEPDTSGMTLRDYFAAKALPEVIRQAIAENWAKEGPHWREAVARECREYADAMLAARAPKEKP